MTNKRYFVFIFFAISQVSICYGGETTKTDDDIRFMAPRIEAIGFRNSNGKENYQNQIQYRYFQPIDWGNGITSTSRIDMTQVSNSGPSSYTAGNNWQMGNTRWTFSTNTRELSDGVKLNGGWRVYFPIGSMNTAYSAAQWEVGPQAGLSYSPKNLGPIVGINPMIRYMMGFNTINQNSQSARNLELYPTIQVKVTEFTRIHFWDETAIGLNANKGTWNVPFDAMIVYSFNPALTGKLGGAIKMNTSPATPNYTAYTGLVFQF